MPSVAINDLDIRGNDLVAATQGRSIWQLDDISPLRQLTRRGIGRGAILFKPADGVLVKPDPQPRRPGRVNLDYYLGAPPAGDVTLEILDAGGRVVHAATSAVADSADRWLPVTRPLSATPGHHRVVWNLRLDPPPAQHHRYAHFAPALFEECRRIPMVPSCLPGSYRVRLTAAGRDVHAAARRPQRPGVGEAPAALRRSGSSSIWR